MSLVRRVTQAGLRLTGSTLELIFGTAADQPAPGNKLPGSYPIDSSGAVARQGLVFNGSSYVPAYVGEWDAAFVAIATTTDATPKALDALLAVPLNTVAHVMATIVASQGTGATGAKYLRSAAFRRTGAGVTLIGAVDSFAADREDNAAWDATLAISGTNVQVLVTGAAATTINWKARVQVTLVS